MNMRASVVAVLALVHWGAQAQSAGAAYVVNFSDGSYNYAVPSAVSVAPGSVGYILSDGATPVIDSLPSPVSIVNGTVFVTNPAPPVDLNQLQLWTVPSDATATPGITLVAQLPPELLNGTIEQPPLIPPTPVIEPAPPLTVSLPAVPPPAALGCTGNFTSVIGVDTTYRCGGDLTVTSGVLAADNSLLLQADGNIYLNELTLLAPIVTIQAGGTLSQTSPELIWTPTALGSDAGSVMLVNSAGISGLGWYGGLATSDVSGQLVLTSDGGGTLTFSPMPTGVTVIDLGTGTVPEPATYALMGLGLVGIAALARRRT
jgi:hypothetical protein